jgi:hypothetical protein
MSFMGRLQTIRHNLVDYIITDKENNFVVLGQGTLQQNLFVGAEKRKKKCARKLARKR